MMQRFTYKRPSTFVFAQTQTQTQTQTKERVNGKIANYNTHTRTAEYDGQVLKIAECDKNKCTNYSIKEKDIEHFIKKGKGANLGLMQQLKANHLSTRARTRVHRGKTPENSPEKIEINKNRNK
jgi:hypothetical protein